MRRRRASGGEQEEGGGGVGVGPRASGMASSSQEGQSGGRGQPGCDSEISESEEEDEELLVLGEEEELDEERLLKMSKMIRFESEVFMRRQKLIILSSRSSRDDRCHSSSELTESDSKRMDLDSKRRMLEKEEGEEEGQNSRGSPVIGKCFHWQPSSEYDL